jgi:hypothetical protein
MKPRLPSIAEMKRYSLAVVVVLAGCDAPTTSSTKPAAKTEQAPLGLPQPGDIGTLRLPGTGGAVFLFANKADLDEATKFVVAKDSDGYAALVRSKSTRVSGGSAARVIESSSPGAVRVRVTGGDTAGVDGWTYKENFTK